MGTVVVIGGYEDYSIEEAWIKTPLEIDREILRLSSKKSPNVLFIPTASEDAEVYIRSIRGIYEGELGANMDCLLLYGDELSKKMMKAKIEWADVIYVGGGNTLKMMKKWRRLGVDEMLKSAYAKGKVMCGVSAGSICWFEFGVSDSLHFYNEEETKYIKVRGLGILPGVHCPHYRSARPNERYRLKGIKEVMKRSKGKCLAVPDGTAMVFQDGRMRSIGLDTFYWCWWEDGQWHEES